MNKFHLFTPGPVNVAENLRAAISREDICHREVDFDLLLSRVETKLLTLFAIRKPEAYRAVVVTGSGTAANESMLSSVVGNQQILVLSNGEFGDRLHEISKIYNSRTHLLKFKWGKSMNLKKIEAYINEHDIDVVCMVHHETSSGMLNPIEQVGALSKANGSLFIVDCVSSAGAEIIDMEKCHIGFFSSSSSKAIGSYAGLSFIVGRVDEFEKLKDQPIKTRYLNLYTSYLFLKRYSQTPNTPAVHLLFALDQALANILDEGVAKRYAAISRRANLLRRGMQELGLNFLIKEEDMCSVLTTVKLPKHISGDELRQKLRDKAIIIYGAKGCFKDKYFQVGNIGSLSNSDINYFLTSLGQVLLSFDGTKLAQVKHGRDKRSLPHLIAPTALPLSLIIEPISPDVVLDTQSHSYGQ